MDKKIFNVALFGCGRIGQIHAKNIFSNSSLNLVYVHDVFSQSAEILANKYGSKTVSNDSEIFADNSIDIVVIASSTPSHMDLIVKAINADKWVLCEKPLDLDLNKINDAYKEIATKNNKVMVGFNRRFDPSFSLIKQRVDNGDIGKLEQLIIISRDPEEPPEEYVRISGGIFKDMTIHDFDMARYFLGDIEAVMAMGTNTFSESIRSASDYDGAFITLKNSKGVYCQIINSRHCAYGYDQRIEAFGSAGSLAAENIHTNSVVSNFQNATSIKSPITHFFLDRYADSYAKELEYLVNSIRNNSLISPGFEDGKQALVCAIAAQISAKENRTVKISEVLS